MLALTATANKETERKIVKSLAMKRYTLIRVSPNKLNIRLSCVKVKKLHPELLKWVVDGLRRQNNKYPKTLIYCQSIENVSKVFVYLKEELGDDMYDVTKVERNVDALLVGIFHCKALEKHKKRVIADFAHHLDLAELLLQQHHWEWVLI
eukprot:gene17126-18846_t